jgi:hypothetical protein
MAEHPSKYVAKKSRPHSDHQLQEPSHMKSDGVDAWLQHWLKLQKRNKRPLILKDGSDEIHPNPTSSSKGKGKGKGKASSAQSATDDSSDEIHPNPTSSSKGKGKGKASRAQSSSDDSSDDGLADDHNNDQSGTDNNRNSTVEMPPPSRLADDNNNEQSGTDNDRNASAKILPPTPRSALETRMGRREFLSTLSEDRNYQKLLLLLRAAHVSNIMSSSNNAIKLISRMASS